MLDFPDLRCASYAQICQSCANAVGLHNAYRAHLFTCSELLKITIMKIYKEIALKNFQPWSGAKSVFYRLTIEELNTLEDILESDTAVYTETGINDLFWFDDEWICETLGINTEEFWNRAPDYQIINL